MDKKIELERMKQKKSTGPAKAAAKKPAKKKTISEEAKDLGLVYTGNNRYMNTEGKVTHIADRGKLVKLHE